jgi:hypothetical protein
MRQALMAFTVFAALGAGAVDSAIAQSLVAAVLPTSRSVQIPGPATAFVTIINTGAATANSVGISLQSAIPATLTYQTTDSTTNQVTGSPNTPVDILAGKSQSYVIAITPQGPIASSEVLFNFNGTNTTPVAPISGVNTLLLSASVTPTPDVIALAATATNDGIVNLPSFTGPAAFSVASSNVGAGGQITVSADTGASSLPVSINLCRTNPQTGQCTSSLGPSVLTQINGGETSTFSVFVTGAGFVPLDPATNRVFVRFREGQAVRGSTSVAVDTRLVGTYVGTGSVTLSSCRFPPNNGTSQGSFTVDVTNQVGNTISGVFKLTSGNTSNEIPFSVTLTSAGDIPATTISFTVRVLGIPIATGTATLTGQINGDTVAVDFSGKAQGIENCNVSGSGTATRT